MADTKVAKVSFFDKKIEGVQAFLSREGIDGWLLYDFRRTNDLACTFLEIPESTMITRRYSYWIPKRGAPLKILHKLEPYTLAHLPGKELFYSSWQEFEGSLGKALNGCQKIAMEYSPRNAIPTVSKVDAGTIEVVRSLGPEVVSSADILQSYTSVWNERQWQSHLKAAAVLDGAAEKAWSYIAACLNKGKDVSEYDVQQFILQRIKEEGCKTSSHPICAVNAHGADPHYSPSKEGSSLINRGDFILIDLWCKEGIFEGPYADITRVAVAEGKPTPRQKEIFDIVRAAQKKATDLVIERFAQDRPLMGWEVDQACRRVIEEAGYGAYFVHRTGHNIGLEDHGSGANIDNLETHDRRHLIPGTCFSIEPGIYIPGEFGVRLEYDVFIHHDRNVEITGGIQNEIVCLTSLPQNSRILRGPSL